MVKFYAPWCDHCNEMQPEYVKLKLALQDREGVQVSMVDCTRAA